MKLCEESNFGGLPTGKERVEREFYQFFFDRS